jgi:hypothetical protein
MKKEVTEAQIFAEIWDERPHVSEISGKKLIEDKNNPFFFNQFMHVLPKSIYSKFRTRKDNIFLGTHQEHYEQTNYPNKTKIRVEWDKFWDRYESLKQEYHAKS